MKIFATLSAVVLSLVALAGCSPEYVPIAHVEVGGHITDQIAVVRTGNGANDGVSGQQLVAVATNHPEFREIGDTVQGETLTAGILEATINAAGLVMAAEAVRPANIDNSSVSVSEAEAFNIASASVEVVSQYNDCQWVEQDGNQFLKPGCAAN